jgi:hypothetical protein
VRSKPKHRVLTPRQAANEEFKRIIGIHDPKDRAFYRGWSRRKFIKHARHAKSLFRRIFPAIYNQ